MNNIAKRVFSFFAAVCLMATAAMCAPEGLSPAISVSAAATQTVTVTGTVVNVRSGAGSGNAVVTTVKKGATYTVEGSAKDSSGKVWYKITVSGKTGYIISTYVSVKDVATTTTTTTTTAAAVQTLTVTGTVVNVRSGAGSGNAVVTTVKKGAKYTVEGSAKDSAGTVWYKITVSGKTGYIVSTYATVTTASTTTTTKSTTASATTTTTAAAAQTLTVTGTVVNVRSGAGSGNAVVTTVKKGAKFSVLGSSKDSAGKVWYKITANGKTGYIISTYVTVATATTASTAATSVTSSSTSTSATTSTTTTTAADAGQILTITGTQVNVRSGAGTKYAIVTTVVKGARYASEGSIKDASGNVWYKITVGKKSGYIISTYVSISTVTTASAGSSSSTSSTASSSTSSTATTATTAAAAQTLTVTGDVVNVRAGAGTSYAKVTSVKKGAKFAVEGSAKDSAGKVWYKITVSGKTGYIISTYVTVAATAATTSTTTSSSAASSSTSATSTTTTTTTTTATAAVQTLTVTGDVVNVRSGAGTSYAKVTSVKKGAKFTVEGSAKDSSGKVWYKITVSGKTGYIISTYVAISSGSTASNTTASNGTTTTTATASPGMSFINSYYTVDAGSTVALNVKMTSISGTVTYTSADSSAAPVSSSGVVTGNTPGLYRITAKCGNYSATTEVVVIKAKTGTVEPMTISEDGTAFIASWEGGGTTLSDTDGNIVYGSDGKVVIVFYPYNDAVGYWTVGYGHAITSAESLSWSRERAIAEFNTSITALIGEEHKITDEKPYLTLEEAQALLHADLKDGVYVSAVSDWMVRNGVTLTQNQFDSLVSFCYNLGPSYWTSDTYNFYLKSAIICRRSGSEAVADQIIEGFCRYIKAGGKSLKGLWYRRRDEAEMFLTGDYTRDGSKFTLPTNITWG